MIQPLGNRILCRAVEAEDHYPGSPIVLTPDRVALEMKQHAEVVAAGPGTRDEEAECFVPVDPRLKPGAWILHADFARVYLNDEKEFFLTEADIVAILEEA